jgi:hypothetical protein
VQVAASSEDLFVATSLTVTISLQLNFKPMDGDAFLFNLFGIPPMVSASLCRNNSLLLRGPLQQLPVNFSQLHRNCGLVHPLLLFIHFILLLLLLLFRE